MHEIVRFLIAISDKVSIAQILPTLPAPVPTPMVATPGLPILNFLSISNVTEPDRGLEDKSITVELRLF